MGGSKVIIRILGILILFISIGWYGNINEIYQYKEEGTVEYKLSFDEARRLLVSPIIRTQNYYYTESKITTYSRTLIPFKYKKGNVESKRDYFHRGK